MTREQLATASDRLRDAAGDLDGEHNERIESQAEALARLAEADRGPDHGRLARIDRILGDVLDATGDERIAEARELVRSYRETVEGV